MAMAVLFVKRRRLRFIKELTMRKETGSHRESKIIDKNRVIVRSSGALSFRKELEVKQCSRHVSTRSPIPGRTGLPASQVEGELSQRISSKF